MANKTVKQYGDFTDVDLANELEGSEVQFRRMKFEHAIKGLANPMELRHLRRNIARIQTEIRRRAMEKFTDEDFASRTKIVLRRRKQ
jgi:large subunit ribosomal protein L29